MSDFNGKPFKEAMCIEAMRVFDSCSSQDCLEDLAFTFSQADQTVINAAAYIKSTCILPEICSLGTQSSLVRQCLDTKLQFHK